MRAEGLLKEKDLTTSLPSSVPCSPSSRAWGVCHRFGAKRARFSVHFSHAKSERTKKPERRRTRPKPACDGVAERGRSSFSVNWSTRLVEGDSWEPTQTHSDSLTWKWPNGESPCRSRLDPTGRGEAAIGASEFSTSWRVPRLRFAFECFSLVMAGKEKTQEQI